MTQIENEEAKINYVTLTYEEWTAPTLPINLKLNWSTHFTITNVPAEVAKQLSDLGYTIQT